jgi:hypothetical protein
MPLIDAIAPARRLAFVGLAKNTGKTTALAAVIPPLHARGERLGVTSIGRDGEASDILNPRIRKPAIPLPAGSLVATTQALLRASGVPHCVAAGVEHRTPLGQVVIARLLAAGSVVVAGPSTGRGSREVSEAMLELGSDRILVDGAINRRVAASPEVADGLVVATGAVLGNDAERVARRTGEAVDLVRIPVVSDAMIWGMADSAVGSMFVAGPDRGVAIDPQIVLGGSVAAVSALFRARSALPYVVVKGPLCESFIDGVLHASRPAEVTLVVEDCTKVFLSRRSVRWYAGRGVRIAALRSVRLCAIVVNPVAPREFQLPELIHRVRAAIPDVPVFDVRVNNEGLVPCIDPIRLS